MNEIQYRAAIISAANNLFNHIDECNALNVFPVPDGDTGTNMSLTLNAAKAAVEALPEAASVAELAAACASAMLRGARGNSGVILSLLFRGLKEGLAEASDVTPALFANALDLGVKAAYQNVMNPTEGTILTVARLAAECALASSEADFIAFFDELIAAAQEALDDTPNLLPVLAKAGVVDAGGQGLLYIFRGMLSGFVGEPIAADNNVAHAAASVGAAGFDDLGDIEFGYCTEFIVNCSESANPAALREFLEGIGDSVVAVADDGIIKIHVHTNSPGEAISAGLKHGFLTSLKIDNMRVQHQNKVVEAEHIAAPEPIEDKLYGFVAVAAGEGLAQMFSDLGCDRLVQGGQTMNPSTEDILRAIEKVPAKIVFVLPNNKNIIMAAEQAAGVSKKRVIVLQTRTIPQGIAAMLAFDETLSEDENALAMTRAIDGVKSGSITFAARDSDFDGHKIKEGDILALSGGKLKFTSKNREAAVVKLAGKIVGKKTQLVTVICGEDVPDDEAGRVSSALEEKLGAAVDLNVFNGGQPVYSYIIGVE